MKMMNQQFMTGMMSGMPPGMGMPMSGMHMPGNMGFNPMMYPPQQGGQPSKMGTWNSG